MKDPISSNQLIELRRHLPELGELASAAREQLFGREVEVYEDKKAPVDGASQWQVQSKCVMACVPTDADACATYLSNLEQLAKQSASICAIVVYSNEANASHRLWLIASARLVLPAAIRVLARHDLLGIRLAQLALDFGADTLCGPVTQARSLPLAGVTRPNETSLDALCELVRQVGLTPTIETNSASVESRATQ